MQKVYFLFLIFLGVACENKYSEKVDEYLTLSEKVIDLYEAPYEVKQDSLIVAQTIQLSELNVALGRVYDKLSESQMSDIIEMSARLLTASVEYKEKKEAWLSK